MQELYQHIGALCRGTCNDMHDVGVPLLQAFTPIITMLALFVAGLETPGKRLILAVLLIAVGTAIASYGEVNLSWVGVACMMASETFEATRLVMTQILLVGLKFHPSEWLTASAW